MKTLHLTLILLISASWGLAQSSPKLVAAGEWSEPVSDKGYALRGRILVYRLLPPDPSLPPSEGPVPNARVYVELEHLFTTAWRKPIELYYHWAGLDTIFEMHDASGEPAPVSPKLIRVSFPPGRQLVTIPCDASIRLRADYRSGWRGTNANDLGFLVSGGSWMIRAGDTNEYFLSGKFTASTNNLAWRSAPPPRRASLAGPQSAIPAAPTNSTHLSSGLNYHPWQGTLDLPAVRIRNDLK